MVEMRDRHGHFTVVCIGGLFVRQKGKRQDACHTVRELRQTSGQLLQGL